VNVELVEHRKERAPLDATQQRAVGARRPASRHQRPPRPCVPPTRP